MQIRLTVVDPLGPSVEARGRAASRDVLLTAPAGTALAAVASALASAVVGGDGPAVLYAGAERLDAARSTLGEPPLTDGAVLYLNAPGAPEPHPELDDAPTRLHVVAGPDAGGVHLLHGGRITVGRSAGADVPLDDPDVSRLHCAVTVAPDGAVSVADLGSTNGTSLNGGRVADRPVAFPSGALLRIGESALRLTGAEGPGARLATTPDGEGHLRVDGRAADGADAARAADAPPRGRSGPDGPYDGTHHAYGTASWGASAGVPRPRGHGRAGSDGGAPVVPGQGGAPRVEDDRPPFPGGAGDTHGGPVGAGPLGAYRIAPHDGLPPDDGTRDGEWSAPGADGPQGTRRRGIGAWARRWTAGRGGQDAAEDAAYDEGPPDRPARSRPGAAPGPETWPDPAALLLTALGPGPRLWERGPGHPETLSVRLGTADRAAPDGSGPLPAVPVTAGLREAGALGLAGPRPRLSGLARAVVAQLAALHSPDVLEIVLICTDRSRSVEERTAEWSWLGWLPHLRPGHGQDCRLLTAFDRDQAAARTDELLRRLADRTGEGQGEPAPGTAAPGAPGGTRPGAFAGPLVPGARRGGADHLDGGHGNGGPVAGPGFDLGLDRAPRTAPGPGGTNGDARPHPAAPHGAGGPGAYTGPYCVVVVDGDPGGPGPREAVARLAQDGPRAGIHVVCLAETAAAPASAPLAETYEAACAVSPVFARCGAVALLGGDVATALRLVRVADAGGHDARPDGTARPYRGPVGPGTTAAVDAVSAAWAERFARALAPLRTDGVPGGRPGRVSAPLPLSARLLDELGLARATPASLMARWADAADDTAALGGRAWAVLGAGPRGPVLADLVAAGSHLLVEGPPGSGRTELLRSVVASLAAAERPDRLGIVLVDGRDTVTGGAAHGDGLRVCTDVPHVTTHLGANDPVLMREFAQSLSAELKRRAELLGREGFAEWHARRELAGRIGPQRTASGRLPDGGGNGDIESAPSSTIRLRPAAARRQTGTGPPLPRLVVVVDDLDALVSPPLGSPGRPAAGSVLRALEAVARDGERLGVHLVTAAGPDVRTAETEPARRASLRVELDAPSPGQDEPAPGRGRLTGQDGRTTAFQGGRVTGRIPRTATSRPTVVALEWQRMGDPPARRPVRELGNGPTDLALLASALERAAREVSAAEVPSLL
ncbi:FHA domain-containing protein [Streptomyces sp. NPDC008150]|uniref:FHA domain-containing protein n=1 Tax=Streptomyces sp. NPDC008150 TaxID=3364816 RepID=UPI0036E8B31F